MRIDRVRQRGEWGVEECDGWDEDVSCLDRGRGGEGYWVITGRPGSLRERTSSAGEDEIAPRENRVWMRRWTLGDPDVPFDPNAAFGAKGAGWIDGVVTEMLWSLWGDARGGLVLQDG